MKRRIFAILGVVFAATAVVLLRSTEWLASLGGHPPARKFKNIEPSRMLTGSYREMLKRQFFGKEKREPAAPIPVVARTAADYATHPPLRATWIGWASVLLEIDGKIVLTDPIWSERCSPSTLVGPKRFHPPPIPLDQLPPVDMVVISHDHYDHLDMATVRFLGARGTQFAVPSGIGAHLMRWGIPQAQIHELDWNQSFELRGLTVTSTPARHYSGRQPRFNNRTLWTSWAIKGPQHRVFFSGDSGYSATFAKIGAEQGPFDLALIKIGASDPTWSEIHMTPEEAVQVARDVRASVMLPVHWATFNLAFHSWRDPAERAVAAAAANGVRIVTPKPGEFVEPSPAAAPSDWWRSL